MIEELETIVLTVDLPEHQLEAGDLGTVVLVHGDHVGYEVEFVALDGRTIAVVSLSPTQIRTTHAGEIIHVRTLN